MTQIKKKIHVKKGDYVQIITGVDKGKTGKILQVISRKGKVIVENINMKTKHIRPKQEGDTGQIIQIEAPISSSNVMLYSTQHKMASRYKYQVDDKNIKKKILIKTGEIIK